MAEDVFLGHFWSVWDALEAAAAASKTGGDGGGAGSGVPDVPGFFHLLTVLALAAFAAEKVDVLVLEVGLGGRLDATNVVEDPVVCGVATLDYDHVEVLGGTIQAIAGEVRPTATPRRPARHTVRSPPASRKRPCDLLPAGVLLVTPRHSPPAARRLTPQKAGIFKPGRPVWTVHQPDGAMPVLDARAERVGCPIAVAEPGALLGRGGAGGTPLVVGPDGAFQRTNAALALALTETFLVATGRAAREGTCVPPTMLSGAVGRVDAAAGGPVPAALAAGLASAHWPGRAHCVCVRAAEGPGGALSMVPPGEGTAGDVVALMDGAHTTASMEQAVAWFRGSAPAGAPRTLVFGCGQEKDAVQLLLPLAAVPWSDVIMCPLAATRPSRREQPTCDGLVCRFLERSDEASGRAPPADTSSAQAGAHAGAGDDNEAPAAGEPWCETLCRLWEAVHSDPRLAEARAAHGVGGDAPAPRARAVASMGDALRGAVRPDGLAACMVTGSLYLVGDCLREVGWEP